MITPITQAFYPRLCELHARGDKLGFINAYHQGAQLVSVFAGSVATVIILFAETFLRLWTQNPELAQRSSSILSLLMLGNLLNGLMWIPYQTQLALGWTSLAVRINIVAVVVIVPAIIWVTPLYGAVGAAWIWIGLNACYLLIGIHFMYRHILSTEKWRWYFQDIFMPIIAGISVVIFLESIWTFKSSNLSDASLLILAGFVALTMSLLFASIPRQLLQHMAKSILRK